MGKNWSKGSSVWTWGRTSSLWGWQSPGTGCPGRLWILLLWRYSRPAWKWSWAACCRWPCFGRGVGLDDPQRSLPTPTILWFCDSVPVGKITQQTFYIIVVSLMVQLLDIIYATKYKKWNKVWWSIVSDITCIYHSGKWILLWNLKI